MDTEIEIPGPDTVEVSSVDDLVDVLRASLTDLAASAIAQLPVIVLALVVMVLGLLLVRVVVRAAVDPGELHRRGADPDPQAVPPGRPDHRG